MYGNPAPSRWLLLAGEAVERHGSGPISWNRLSIRLTSTTWPTPLCSATIVANADATPVISSVRAIGRQQGLPARLAADRGQPGHRLGDGGEAGAPGVRAGLAETGDPA